MFANHLHVDPPQTRTAGSLKPSCQGRPSSNVVSNQPNTIALRLFTKPTQARQ